MPNARSLITPRRAGLFATAMLVLAALGSMPASADTGCPDRTAGHSNLYWGDLHVHTGFSMDAYAFGNRSDPGDAFAYARGQSLLLQGGKTASTIRRPLDFMAVTDHAETFDVMYLCTDPQFVDNDYCKDFRAGSTPTGAADTFRNFLLPVIAGKQPARSPLCAEPGIDCPGAALHQWRRSQEFANAADKPCEFTAFVGSEWSATPDNRHWHRNLIFASDAVTREALDYVRYPDVGQLWSALEQQCRPEAGCDVITIPHNTNLSESGNFAIETDSDRRRQQRIKYERLVEIHQSKGNSECLPENRAAPETDCAFEIALPRSVSTRLDEDTFTQEDWLQLRSSYARHLLSRGLEAYQPETGDSGGNPLRLGFIGSTDTHSATPGNTAEDNWQGDVWAGDDTDGRFRQLQYNPGGLVAVWAEQNTRGAIFAALKNRRVYGTSGTRIGLRFMADRQFDAETCRGPLPAGAEAEMGGSLAASAGRPRFLVQASMDTTPLARVDIVRGRIVDGRAQEQVTTIFEDPAGRSNICVTWMDEEYQSQTPAYWYARVLEQPSPRWSRLDCQRLDNCDTYPGADRMIQERAWSSPIWNQP